MYLRMYQLIPLSSTATACRLRNSKTESTYWSYNKTKQKSKQVQYRLDSIRKHTRPVKTLSANHIYTLVAVNWNILSSVSSPTAIPTRVLMRN